MKRLQRQINLASDRRASVAVSAKQKAILTAEATAAAMTESNGSEDIRRAGGATETPLRPMANHCSGTAKETRSMSRRSILTMGCADLFDRQ